MTNQPELDLATLCGQLRRLQRRPRDAALRLQVASQVAVLAEHVPADHDRLLHEIVGVAKLLRRALDRINKTAPHIEAGDLAAMKAWMERLEPLLARATTR
jgi:chemotaxis regulatin CheY-phosphate phosphatase CheZ